MRLAGHEGMHGDVMTRGTCSFWLRGIPLRAAW
jgi:hypothetical protein